MKLVLDESGFGMKVVLDENFWDEKRHFHPKLDESVPNPRPSATGQTSSNRISVPLASCSPMCACGADYGGSMPITAMVASGHGWARRRCVWEQAAWSEWATADGHAVANIFYDFLKALVVQLY